MNDRVRLKIAIVVHGRFYAFDLARELLVRGHDVFLFTNYPPFVAARFGVPRHRVRSFLLHGILSRVASRVLPHSLDGMIERRANIAFGRWAARQLAQEPWDVVHIFSGVAEDAFRRLARTEVLKTLARGSTHVAVQQSLLRDESHRIGLSIEIPSDWIVARESREYRLADAIFVLSEFARKSFLDRGIPEDKLFQIRLGANGETFSASEEAVRTRCARILAGDPIHVLNVGNFSCQKGAWDWARVIDLLTGPRFLFRFVGAVTEDARGLARQLGVRTEFAGKFPQHELPFQYDWGDVFVLPTIQDGFAVVLTQALAAGLPLITTTNCAGPDLIREGQTGWVVPIRSPGAIVDRLRWLDEHREEFVQAVKAVHAEPRRFDWSETARQAEAHFYKALAQNVGRSPGTNHAD